MEHIRVRSGMYIGRLGDGSQNDDGIYVLLKEVMDNGIDEFKMGAGIRIEVNIDENLRVSVRDDGRGIFSDCNLGDDGGLECRYRLLQRVDAAGEQAVVRVGIAG